MQKNNNNLEKAKKFLYQSAIRRGATPAGAEYFVQTVSPWHNDSDPVAPLPDGCRGKSVTMRLKQALTVTAPASAAGGAWDAQFAIMPVETLSGTAYGARLLGDAGTLGVTADNYNTLSQQGVWPDYPVGFSVLTVCTGAEGGTTFTYTNANTEYEELFYLESLFTATGVEGLSRRARIIGGSLKIENVTAELYKQGKVVVYRNDLEPLVVQGMQVGDVGSTSVSYLPVTIYQGPVGTYAEAVKMGGTVYPASEGVAAPLCVRPNNVPTAPVAQQAYVIMGSEDGSGYSMACGSAPLAVSNTSLANPRPAGTPTGLSMTAAYFAGLSNSTALEATLTLDIQIFPQPQDQLAPLAQLVTTNDPIALGLVSEVIAHMPPGMVASANDAGTWLTEAAQWVAGAVGKVARALKPIPIVGPAAEEFRHDVQLVTSGVKSIVSTARDIKRQIDDRSKRLNSKPKKAPAQRKK